MEQCIGIYLRVSLEDFDLKRNLHKDESNSIFGQRNLINRYIQDDKTLNNLPVKEFVDDGFTGTNFERPSFQKMLEEIKNGKISCVIVKDLSRFGRNYLEVGDYLEHLFPFLGVRFVAVNDYYDSEDYSGENAGVDIAFKNILHDYYSRDLSMKIRTAQRSRMLQGKYVNTPPYGYKRDPEHKHHLVPDENTAWVVKKIFQMIIEGSSTSQVALYLNKNHISTPMQAKSVRRKKGMLCEKPLMWTHHTVLNILGNYKYVGAMVNHTRESQALRDKVQKRMPEDEWIVNEGMHDALISHEEFRQARQALRKVKKYNKKEADLTSCVYYCGHCGRKLRKTYGLTTYLTCRTFKYVPDAECRTIRWVLPDIEKIVLESFKVQLLFLQSLKKNMKNAENNRGKEYIGEMKRIKNQLERYQDKKVKLYTEYRQGILSRDGFILKKLQLSQEEETLKQEMIQIRNIYEKYIEEKALEDEQRVVVDQYSGYMGLPDEELIALMYQGVERVMVYNDKRVEITWKFQDVFKDYGRKAAV